MKWSIMLAFLIHMMIGRQVPKQARWRPPYRPSSFKGKGKGLYNKPDYRECRSRGNDGPAIMERAKQLGARTYIHEGAIIIRW